MEVARKTNCCKVKNDEFLMKIVDLFALSLEKLLEFSFCETKMTCDDGVAERKRRLG